MLVCDHTPLEPHTLSGGGAQKLCSIQVEYCTEKCALSGSRLTGSDQSESFNVM